MATDLLSLAKGVLTPDVLGKLSSYLGESPASTGRALEGAVPAVLGGLVRNASTEQGAASLLRTVQQGGYDGSLLNNLGSALSGGTATQNLLNSGSGLLSTILGGNLGSIVSSLSGSSGLKGTSITSLLGLVAPIVMSLIGKQVGSQGLNAAGLMSLLVGQRDMVQRALPGGLGSMVGEFGRSASHAAGAASAAVGSAVGSAADQAAGGAKWLWPLLIAGLLLLGLWYFLRGSGQHTVETAQEAGATVGSAADQAAGAPTDAASNAAEAATGAVGNAADAAAGAAKDAGAAVADAAKKLATFKLPGGVNLDLAEGTINYQIAKFLESGEGTLPKTFVFDNLNFDTASATIKPDSKETIENLTAILKAYPAAEARLDGHTDNVGAAASNRSLSEARAAAVKTALVAGGLDAKRLATAGWGQEKPVATNDTEEGRAQNRRTELTIVKR